MLKNIFKKEHLIFWGVVIALVLVDLVFKIVTNGVENLTLIPWALVINSVHNPGAAFGIMGGLRWTLISISLVLLVGLTWFHIKNNQKNKLYYFGMGLIFAGAYGNLIDRISLGYVRDFIFTGFMPWFTFNLADAFLTIGMILFGIYFIKDFKFTEKNTEVAEVESTNDNEG